MIKRQQFNYYLESFLFFFLNLLTLIFICFDCNIESLHLKFQNFIEFKEFIYLSFEVYGHFSSQTYFMVNCVWLLG